ncbi:hypothetical protein [Candidatus Parabeggiatoa sp. HSG14]|uniref:hypothetical protein n=1 Tax=Candidatus Parabeggiatoa sp. HSG14 TaxID=3055593 RepID=UPI0025A69A8B|nr:hypothetical protein [Thiotrichales bacterium HSG14]
MTISKAVRFISPVLPSIKLQQEEGYENEDPIAKELEKIMRQRQKLPHISFFAFTPKPKTFEISGIPDANQ